MPSLYYTLIASLPPLPQSIDVERLPISQIRLDERLKMLEEHDADLLRELRLLLSLPALNTELITTNEPSGQGITHETKQTLETEKAFIAHYEKQIKLMHHHAAKKVAGDYLDMLLLVNAMMRRASDMPPPESDRPIVVHLRRYWKRNDFILADQYRWIGEVDRKLREGDVLTVYRILLEYLHRHWGQAACCCQFSSDALILYVARWKLLTRWASLDADQGKQVLDTIVKEAIGDYDQYFA